MIHSTCSTTAQVLELKQELKQELQTHTKVQQAQNRALGADANTDTANIASRKDGNAARETAEAGTRTGTAGTSS